MHSETTLVPRPPRLSARLAAIGTITAMSAVVLAACTSNPEPDVSGGTSATDAPVYDRADWAETDSAINGYRSVGYYVQWGVYARDYHFKDVDVSGMAENLTHINYAFGNIDPVELTCFEVTETGVGDAWADYEKFYDENSSVSGEADVLRDGIAGQFNQLRQLKAKHPHLSALISLGGWTWSKNFSLAAATPESREKLVASCIDLYIKGNLPEGRYGGEGSAEGIFDGIDLDWEWPGSSNGHPHNVVDLDNDKANFKELVKEFRRQLDELSATTGKRYLLTAYAPANKSDIDAGGWNDPELFEYFDFVNVQGYDYHGTWEPSFTGHQSNLFDDPNTRLDGDNATSVDDTIAYYLATGIDPSQLVVGHPLYGRGWKGVTTEGAGNGAWADASGPAPGTYEDGYEDYFRLKDGQWFFDETSVSSWTWDGENWWTVDHPDTVRIKAQWIAANGLGGAAYWELDADRDGDLPAAIVDVFRAATAGPVTSSR